MKLTFEPIGMVHSPFKRRKNIARTNRPTRSSYRPNSLGLAIVKVLKRKENVIKVFGIDMIDGIPILDIKPYMSRDIKSGTHFGWLGSKISNKS